MAANRALSWLESLLQDVRYAWRGLRHAPAFAMVALLTLALGIGATTAIFSTVNAILIRPLPYKDSQRIVHLWTINPMFPGLQMGSSESDAEDIKAGVQAFDSVAIYRMGNMSLTGASGPEQVRGGWITSDFFALLGISLEKGRSLTPADDQNKTSDPALLSHRLWVRHFGADPNILGKTITLDQKLYTVTGVLPASFSFPSEPEVWIPLTFTTDAAGHSRNRFCLILAKLKPGVPPEKARAEMNSIAARLAVKDPENDAGIGFELVPLREEIAGKARPGLMLLLAGAGFLLLIACANTANLILSRGMRRRQEIAVRAALGASRLRIVRQMFVENLLLSLLGGIVGLAVAAGSLKMLRAFAPANLPRLNEVQIEPAIAWIGLAVASLAGILCGLAPALHGSRGDLNGALKDRWAASPVSAWSRRFSLRGLLVIGEVAMALVLLTGSALMVQSMVRMFRVDTGFRTDHLLSARIDLPATRYATPETVSTFTKGLLDALHSRPSLSRASITSSPTLGGNMMVTSFEPKMLSGETKPVSLELNAVTPGFFEMLGIPMLSGRTFNEHDSLGATKVVILNEMFAHRFYPGQNPVGRILSLSPDPGDQKQIVGVVANTRDVSLRSEPRPEIYVPLLQGWYRSLHLLIRTEGDPLALANELGSTVRVVDKDLPVSKIQSLTEVMSNSVAEPRFQTWLLSAFATVGLALTLIGIYGVISYSVSLRTQEIGIRMALGARRGNVLRLVLREGILLALAGVAIGVAGSLLLMRLLASQIFEIKPTDPLTFSVTAFLMILTGVLASYIPARRATSVDPILALRQQ